MTVVAGVRTKSEAESKARRLGHRLGRWDAAGFLLGRGGGHKAQCARCGRSVVVTDREAHGDALEVRCG